MALQKLQSKMQDSLRDTLPKVCVEVLGDLPWVSIKALVGVTLPLDQVILVDLSCLKAEHEALGIQEVLQDAAPEITKDAESSEQMKDAESSEQMKDAESSEQMKDTDSSEQMKDEELAVVPNDLIEKPKGSRRKQKSSIYGKKRSSAKRESKQNESEDPGKELKVDDASPPIKRSRSNAANSLEEPDTTIGASSNNVKEFRGLFETFGDGSGTAQLESPVKGRSRSKPARFRDSAEDSAAPQNREAKTAEAVLPDETLATVAPETEENANSETPPQETKSTPSRKKKQVSRASRGKKKSAASSELNESEAPENPVENPEVSVPEEPKEARPDDEVEGSKPTSSQEIPNDDSSRSSSTRRKRGRGKAAKLEVTPVEQTPAEKDSAETPDVDITEMEKESKEEREEKSKKLQEDPVSFEKRVEEEINKSAKRPDADSVNTEAEVMVDGNKSPNKALDIVSGEVSNKVDESVNVVQPRSRGRKRKSSPKRIISSPRKTKDVPTVCSTEIEFSDEDDCSIIECIIPEKVIQECEENKEKSASVVSSDILESDVSKDLQNEELEPCKNRGTPRSQSKRGRNKKVNEKQKPKKDVTASEDNKDDDPAPSEDVSTKGDPTSEPVIGGSIGSDNECGESIKTLMSDTEDTDLPLKPMPLNDFEKTPLKKRKRGSKKSQRLDADDQDKSVKGAPAPEIEGLPPKEKVHPKRGKKKASASKKKTKEESAEACEEAASGCEDGDNCSVTSGLPDIPPVDSPVMPKQATADDEVNLDGDMKADSDVLSISDKASCQDSLHGSMKKVEIRVKRLPPSVVDSLPHLPDACVAKLNKDSKHPSSTTKHPVSKDKYMGKLLNDLEEIIDEETDNNGKNKSSDKSGLSSFHIHQKEGNLMAFANESDNDDDDEIMDVTIAEPKPPKTTVVVDVHTSAEEDDGGTLSDYSARLNQSLQEMETGTDDGETESSAPVAETKQLSGDVNQDKQDGQVNGVLENNDKNNDAIRQDKDNTSVDSD